MKFRIIISFVFVNLLVILIYQYMQNAKEEAIEEFNYHSLLTTKATYSAVIDTYEVAAKKDFIHLMSNEKILNLLHKFKKSTTIKEKNLLRGDLYRLIYKSYDSMKLLFVRQFHFHTHDGKSLLRMHLPYESGDSLMECRTSVRLANTQLKNVTGFEGGRIYSGFRYIFPIIDKGEHLGSVEFSISFEAIENKLKTLLPEYIYQLIISKDDSYDKTFDWHRSFFSVSELDSDYYVENTLLSSISSKNVKNEFVAKLIELAKKSTDFKKRIKAHKDFFIPIIDNNKGYAVNFIAFKNTDNKHAGYIVYFALEDEIIDITYEYNLYMSITFGMVIIVFILLLALINQVEKLRQHKNKLQSINNSLNEAQRVAHFGFVEYLHTTKKYYISDEVYKILGVNPKTFKPSLKSFLSLVHKDDVKMVYKKYIESIKNKSNYESCHRMFKSSGELCYVEGYGSHEFDKTGKIIKSIGTLYDVTNQMIAYESLERFVNLQSSIVILTDGDSFQFANKSFYNFFGYENLDAFKEDYSCICDKFIENDDFFHLKKVKEFESNWVESLLNLSVRKRIVFMLDSTSTPHAFSVNINKYDNKVYEIEFNDISDSMIEKMQLEQQLNIDQLTKAYNRVYFETNKENIIRTNKEQNAQTGIIFFDIDHFKDINDTYGHDVGDEVLISLVKVVKEQIRVYDHLVRWGGEEFLIVTRVESYDGIKQMTENIRIKIQNYNFKNISKLTCSFGIAIHNENEDIKSTITNADQKLYEAKEGGRNKVVM